MITDLHSGPLLAERWGPKASNLARLASAGITVPPGLCLWPHVVGAAARDHAVDAWLSENRVTSLIVRSSTANEDGSQVSGAGRSLSLPSVPPDRTSVANAIEAVAAASTEMGHDLRSVVVQEEVVTSSSGVVFYTRRTGELIVEADTTRFVVTSGFPVTTRARIARNGLATAESGSLAAPEARALAAVAASCAAVLDCDPDIEWGYLAGAVFVFQARPITRAVDA